MSGARTFMWTTQTGEQRTVRTLIAWIIELCMEVFADKKPAQRATIGAAGFYQVSIRCESETVAANSPPAVSHCAPGPGSPWSVSSRC